MIVALLIVVVCFLAYSNGANDNFKGVASLYGSGTCSYKTALTWATLTTFAGSVAAIFLAEALLKKFSGKGLVPDALAATPIFLLTVAIGAGATVMLATRFGFPVSTTHALTGAMVGAGLSAAGSPVNFSALGKTFVLPLLLSPVIAVIAGGLIYFILRQARLKLGISKETCICVGAEEKELPLPQPMAAAAAHLSPKLLIAVDQSERCTQRYVGTFLGISGGRMVDTAHFFSAGIVGFARGLNDTPKIAALMLVLYSLDIRLGMVGIAVAMATGGWLGARRVAETMSHGITNMNAGQGFAANVGTGIIVVSASVFGLPVSTTHVSVGSLFGIGLTTGQARWRAVTGIVMSWVITLPCAAAVGAVAYWTATKVGWVR